MAKSIMIQGTASDAGKSILTAALCRVLAQADYKVAPFKSQNMSLNSYITKAGKEIAIAQAVQAEAALVDPEVNMSPILMKPNADNMSQIILQGKIYKNMQAADYFAEKEKFISVIKKAIADLKSRYDILVLEGGGNPAEVNLRDKDFVNMKVAEIAKAPVILVADIDKGGVFASIVGTLDLLTEAERRRVKGIIVNKFRGDPANFESGVELIEKHTQKKVLGVIPFLKDLDLPSEDSIKQQSYNQKNFKLDIVVIAYPKMSNFTDFDYFKNKEEVRLRYLKKAADFGNPDLIILPGSKTTINDLKFLYESKLAAKIIEAAAQGKMIIGICGGYQMLGQKIKDPNHYEGKENEIEGLSLLKTTTILEKKKIRRQVKAETLNELKFLQDKKFTNLSGYEIHQGRTLNESEGAVFKLKRQKLNKTDKIINDGAVNKAANVWGTYIHNIFINDNFRNALLNYLLEKKGYQASMVNLKTAAQIREDNYNYLAEEFKKYIDLKALYKIIFAN